jgi:hypothetical protein
LGHAVIDPVESKRLVIIEWNFWLVILYVPGPLNKKAAPGRSSAIGHRRNKLPSRLQASSSRLEISRLPIQERAQNDKAATSHQQQPNP